MAYPLSTDPQRGWARKGAEKTSRLEKQNTADRSDTVELLDEKVSTELAEQSFATILKIVVLLRNTSIADLLMLRCSQIYGLTRLTFLASKNLLKDTIPRDWLLVWKLYGLVNLGLRFLLELS